MLGGIAVTGLGAAVILATSALGTALAVDGTREARPTPADLRKADDEPGEPALLAYDDDTGGNTGGTDTRGSAPSRASNPDTTDARRGVRVFEGQLLINQRISQAAVRRANALLAAEPRR